MLCWFSPSTSMNQPQVCLCPLPPEPPLPPPTPPQPSRLSQSTGYAPRAIPLIGTSVCFSYGEVSVSVTSFNLPQPLLPCRGSWLSVLCVCVSTAALQVGSSIPFSPRCHVSPLFSHVCLSCFWLSWSLLVMASVAAAVYGSSLW